MSELEEKIAGEITISEDPGEVIRKWREIFEVSQTELAKKMNVAPSVISDYEKGRRKPGTVLVRKIVKCLLDIDKEKGGEVIDRFSRPGQEGILAKREFPEAVPLMKIIDEVDADILNKMSIDKPIYGYTVIDSLKAILSMKSFDYLSIYGYSTERILFFTGVEHGRSPLVAIRSTPLTPAAVGYIKPKKVDDLSRKLAEVEGIPLIRTDYESKKIIGLLEKWL